MKTLHKNFKYLAAGDRGLLVELGTNISLEVNQKVHSLNLLISKLHLKGVEECVPTYRSLLVYFNPAETSVERLADTIKGLETDFANCKVETRRRVVEVPVAYGGTFGPDLDFVAKYHNLDVKDVVQIHSGREYTVYMIGFIAGFPYLGKVAGEIATPRLETPRMRVPQGSVGIAGRQTGIYPCESPGGWQIIGRTSMELFCARKNPPTAVEPGDTVKFKPVEEVESED